jgi:hypothetical protein
LFCRFQRDPEGLNTLLEVGNPSLGAAKNMTCTTLGVMRDTPTSTIFKNSVLMDPQNRFCD